MQMKLSDGQALTLTSNVRLVPIIPMSKKLRETGSTHILRVDRIAIAEVSDKDQPHSCEGMRALDSVDVIGTAKFSDAVNARVKAYMNR